MVIAVEASLVHQQVSSWAELGGRVREGRSARDGTRSSVSIGASPSFSAGGGRVCVARVGECCSRTSRLGSQHVGSLTPFESRAVASHGNSIVGVTAARSVNAAIAETDGPDLKWWEKGSAPNIHDVHSTQEFLDALSGAGNKLVVVEFFATWCGSCRALYPKFCKLAEQYSDAHFIKVNFDENKPMCKSLNIKVLPFFHIYKGAAGKLDGFSCSLSKLQKLKDAIATHYGDSDEGSEGIDVAAILQGEDLRSPAVSDVTVLDTKADQSQDGQAGKNAASA
ncbi:hypothetical protein MPTK1_2g25750 [Marchantia polymorpha subsp. ruderalis]|nr:hypothetical protein MARPO_0025s0103 [Marchantia polymorpha]BBN03712.1 hypothetical protein Mp_2g25750 [Marchantia polymorpha subsp. ruderalis]|eukprot:PTQ43420.1 hypothetical protein MARPO_0025s0103 [Marchantia polymorpha]